jgi:hypothetical protein
LSIHVAEMKLRQPSAATDGTTASSSYWLKRSRPIWFISLTLFPSIQARFSCPILLTLHDLYPYEVPSNFGLPKVLFNRFILQQCLRSATSIACVSDHPPSAGEVLCPGSPAKGAAHLQLR